MRRIAGAIVFMAALAGCAAENDPGWTSGANATPFDTAEHECEDRTQAARGPAYEECMASLGWTHPHH